MKKLLAGLTALMFVIAVLAGCGSENKTDAANSAKQTATVQQQEQRQQKQQDKQQKQNKPAERERSGVSVERDGTYTDKEHVAAYIHKFGKLPANYITKAQAGKLGWKTKGTLDQVAPGKSIGGDRFGNFEGILPKKSGRTYTECDIDYKRGNRGAKRIVFSNDGLIFYSASHYKDFERLY